MRWLWHVHRQHKCIAAWIRKEPAEAEAARKGGVVCKIWGPDCHSDLGKRHVAQGRPAIGRLAS